MTGNIKKFLIVDDDPDFLNYLFSVTEGKNVDIDSCNSIKEFSLRKLDKYDAFIIDKNLKDGCGLDLIPAIRKSGSKLIAVVSADPTNTDEIRAFLKENKVDYVLEKPLYPKDIDSLIYSLINTSIKQEKTSSNDAFERIKRKYDASIPDKIKYFSDLIKTLKDDPNQKNLQALRDFVHKTAGNAGSYGYSNVTKHCRKCEYESMKMLETEKPIDPEWLKSLDDFLKNVINSYQFVSEQSEQEVVLKNIHDSNRNTVYIVNDNLSILEKFEDKKNLFGIHLIVESDPKKAMNLLQQESFNPRVVIVAERFPASEITGYDLIDSLKNKQSYLKAFFGLFLEDDIFDLRFKAVKKGINYVFTEPFNPITIMQAISEDLELSLLRDVRVLVLDDDADICDLIDVTLTEIGIHVHKITDESKLFHTLSEFNPDILILDIFLPKYSGLELLEVLRTDLRYRKLVIMIVTSKKDLMMENKAFDFNTTNILYKPIDKKNLQKRVSRLLREVYSSKSNDKSITEIEKSHPLYSLIKDTLFYRIENQFLVLIEVDRLYDLELEIGLSETSKLLSSVNIMLIEMENNDLSCFVLSKNKFILFFKNYQLDNVKQKLLDLPMKKYEISSKNVCFNCSVVPVLDPIQSPRDVLKIAEKTLEEAKNKETSRIRVSMFKIAKTDQMQVVLVDSDHVVLNVLENAFLSLENVFVRKFSRGQEALAEILSYDEYKPPNLIISERGLDDFDGIMLLQKLKSHFVYEIPFFFLSMYISNQDIKEGIKQGALEYFTKPFDVSLLMLKAERVIYK